LSLISSIVLTLGKCQGRLRSFFTLSSTRKPFLFKSSIKLGSTPIRSQREIGLTWLFINRFSNPLLGNGFDSQKLLRGIEAAFGVQILCLLGVQVSQCLHLLVSEAHARVVVLHKRGQCLPQCEFIPVFHILRRGYARQSLGEINCVFRRCLGFVPELNYRFLRRSPLV
jgi:hypothetical protein